MDGVSTAASVIAVIQVTASVVSTGLQYFLEVKNAQADARRLQTQVDYLMKVTNDTRDLLDGPNGDRFKTSKKLYEALLESSSELEYVKTKLKDQDKPKTGRLHRMMGRLQVRSLEWPFARIELEATIAKLTQQRQLLSSALALDNTYAKPHLAFVLLDIR